MPQTFYVAPDEEILSVVSRLRSSALLENVFVVPKRALILQSIVNLRMLARESEKLGKTVVIVTQDEQGRALAEKLGLPTRAYSEDMKMRADGADAHIAESGDARIQSVTPPTQDLGSDDFFSSDPRPATIQPTPDIATAAAQQERSELRLRVRDNTPKRMTTLNSVASTGPVPSADPMTANPPFQGIRQEAGPANGMRLNTVQASPTVMGAARAMAPNPQQAVAPTYQPQPAPSRNEERVKQLFAQKPPVRTMPQAKPTKPVEVSIGGHGKFWLTFFAIVSLLSLGGVAFFLFVPKAEVLVTPQSRSENISLTFSGSVNEQPGNANIAIRLIEKDQEESVSVDATGTSAGETSKAKGTIILSNTYGKDSQSLVATTRIASSDGKIFRLTKGVVIPGMTVIGGTQAPGVIEADVIADQAGADYNLPSGTTFSIPGFKGSAKYDKFSAKSKSSFTGGGSSDSGTKSIGATITEADVAKGKSGTDEAFRTFFGDAVGKDLGADDKFVADSEDVATTGTPTHPNVGIAAQSFDYKASFKGRVYVFSEAEVKEKASALLSDKINQEDKTLKLDGIILSYDEAVPDYDAGTLSLKVTASATFLSAVDTDKIRDDLLGKGSGDIKAVLDNHPEIKKIEINQKPNFFALSIPKSKDRVTVILKKE